MGSTFPGFNDWFRSRTFDNLKKTTEKTLDHITHYAHLLTEMRLAAYAPAFTFSLGKRERLPKSNIPGKGTKCTESW